MVLMDDDGRRHHAIVKPEQAYQRIQRFPQTLLLKRTGRGIVNPEYLKGTVEYRDKVVSIDAAIQEEYR